MDVKLSVEEMKAYRQVLQGDSAGQKALATLEKHDGSFDNAFDELLVEKYGQPQGFGHSLPFNVLLGEKYGQPRGFGHSLREVILKNLRQEICGDDSLRTKVQEYTKNPGNAPLLTGLVIYLISLVGTGGFPIDPAIATIVVLYIVKIGLNIFCDYTEPTDDSEKEASGN